MRNLERLNKDEVLSKLKTKTIGQNIIHFDLINSTNKQAKKLIQEDCKLGTIIIAEEQSMGCGRFERVWNSPKGGLWFSIILKPEIILKDAPKITIIMAASIHKTLESYNIQTEIKWPNDILINKKKICGILAEMKTGYVILGVGININVVEMDSSIRSTATSLKIEFNKEFSREDILAEILNNFERLYNKFVYFNDFAEVISICKNNSSVIGERGILIRGNEKEEVICLDVLDNGNLLVKNGIREEEIVSGEISFKKSLLK